MKEYIISIETVKIKDFLFSTNKLQCIQGASFQLDYLNTHCMNKIFKKFNIKYTSLSFRDLDNLYNKDPKNFSNNIFEKIKDADVFYNAAGNSKFKFKVENEDLLNDLIKEIKLLYYHLAPGAKIVIHKKEIKEKDKYSEIISNLSKETAIMKNIGLGILNEDLVILKKCNLSGNELAEFSEKNIDNIKEILKIDSPYIYSEILNSILESLDLNLLKKHIKELVGSSTYYISRETLMKLIFSIRGKTSDNTFYNSLLENLQKANFNLKIEEFADSKQFIGFVYSDGDGLGDYIKTKTLACNTNEDNANEDYEKFIKTFSIMLDYITKSSIIDALKNIYSNKDNKKIGSVLIAGGDDFCALFNPIDAINIVKNYHTFFEKKAKILGLKITSSTGLLFVKHKVPIHLMFEKALVLQKSAKQKRHIEKIQDSGYIDFQNIGSQGNVNIFNYRNGKDNVSKRAYKTNDFISLLNKILNIKCLNFPTNKLRRFYEIKSNKNINIPQQNMKILNYLFKLDENIIYSLVDKNLLENINKNILNSTQELCPDILDIIELYSFMEVL